MQGASHPPRLPTLFAYVEYWASQRPDSIAVSTGREQVSYRELRERVDNAAQWLLHRGVQRGDVIAILAPPSFDFLCMYVAAASLGATILGLNPKHTKSELDFVIDDCAPRLIFARRTYRGERTEAKLAGREVTWLASDFSLPSAPPGAPAQIARAQLDEARANVSPNDAALIVYTSGSTGRPKGALISQDALIQAAWQRCSAWPVEPFRILSNLPINHIGGAGDIACMALVAGGSQHVMENFDAARTLAFIASERVTVWYQVPTMFQLALDGANSAASRPPVHLGVSIWSGGQASSDLARRLAAISDFVATDYSMTESVGPISLSCLTRDIDYVTQSSGRPPEGRKVRIIDVQTEDECACGKNGEIRVRDDFIMSGYHGRPDATQAAMDSDGWFRTGDVGHFRADGALVITGRISAMFKSGGYNVYPQEIEQALEAHPQVSCAAVIGVPDPVYAQVGWAFVAPAAGANLETDELKTWCRERLANYKVPKRFEISHELPMLPIGKIDRARLVAQVEQICGAIKS